MTHHFNLYLAGCGRNLIIMAYPANPPGVVCYTAVFSVVTQRCPKGGALRDDTKNTFDHSPSNTFEGERVGSIEMGGLFNLAKMMVSVHLKELECKLEKSITTSWRSYRRGSKTNLNFQPVNKPS